ncbi:MAG: hypothetical protein LIP23_05820, partial [Planctomycetes bacterium]|nr:hypothetical protein [Planctomycetota bacterium]
AIPAPAKPSDPGSESAGGDSPRKASTEPYEKETPITVVMENPAPPTESKKKSNKPTLTVVKEKSEEVGKESSLREMTDKASAGTKLPVKNTASSAVAQTAKSKNPAAVLDDSVNTEATPIPVRMPYIRVRVRKRKRFIPLCWFFILFVIPSSLVCVYYHSIATPMYVSDMKLVMRQGDSISARGGDILTTLFNAPSSLSQDGRLILAFIHSPQLLGALNRDLDLFAHYSAKDIDFHARLPDDATVNDFLKYWSWVVTPRIDSDSGLIEIGVKAFSPEMAHEIAVAMLAYCEDFVNRLNDRVREDSMLTAQSELARAELRLQKASQSMESFRKEYGMMDLHSSASTQTGIVSGLATEIAKLKAE